MIPKTFTLGGMEHQVLLKEVPGYRWRNFPPIKELHLAPLYEGKPIREDIIEKHFWESVTCLIVDRVMLRCKNPFADNRVAYGHLVAQVMIQLTKFKDRLYCFFSRECDKYGIQVGGSDIGIIIDNEECSRRKIYGEYDANNERILLQTEGVSEEVFMKHHPDFILRVLIHELLHAVTTQLGLEQTKWNTEHNINTMAFFFTEVYLSLKPVDKEYGYTESTNGVLRLGDL